MIFFNLACHQLRTKIPVLGLGRYTTGIGTNWTARVLRFLSVSFRRVGRFSGIQRFFRLLGVELSVLLIQTYLRFSPLSIFTDIARLMSRMMVTFSFAVSSTQKTSC